MTSLSKKIDFALVFAIPMGILSTATVLEPHPMVSVRCLMSH